MDIFFIGPPKTGTTFLHSVLRHHPQIACSSPKELNFFLSATSGLSKILNYRHYKACFNTNEKTLARAEFSIWYLYSVHACENIRKMYPNAKIVISSRDPVDFIVSLHSQLLFSGTIKTKSPFKAFMNSVNSYSDINISKLIDDPNYTLESRSNWKQEFLLLSQFHFFIDMWIKAFDKGNVLLLDINEIYDSPSLVMSKIHDFLEVDDIFYPNSILNARVNTAKMPASKLLSQILASDFLLFLYRTLIKPLKSLFKAGSFNLVSKLYSLNRRPLNQSHKNYIQEQKKKIEDNYYRIIADIDL